MGKKVILGLFCFILLFCFATAQPPFQEFIGQEGLQLEYQKFDNLKIGEPFTVHAHVFNLSNGAYMTNETTDCFFHGYYKNGSHAAKAEMSWDDNFDWELALPSSFFTGGEGSWIMQCNTSTLGGFASGSIKITTTGTDLSTAQAIIYLISFSFLILIFGLLMWAVFQIPADTKDDEGFVVNVSKFEYLRPVAKGLAWIVLTAIVFIVANITIAYLSTGLMGSFLFLIFQLMMLSNLIIIPLMIIRMIQRITLSKEMLGLIERGVKFN